MAEAPDPVLSGARVAGYPRGRCGLDGVGKRHLKHVDGFSAPAAGGWLHILLNQRGTDAWSCIFFGEDAPVTFKDKGARTRAGRFGRFKGSVKDRVDGWVSAAGRLAASPGGPGGPYGVRRGGGARTAGMYTLSETDRRNEHRFGSGSEQETTLRNDSDHSSKHPHGQPRRIKATTTTAHKGGGRAIGTVNPPLPWP